MTQKGFRNCWVNNNLVGNQSVSKKQKGLETFTMLYFYLQRTFNLTVWLSMRRSTAVFCAAQLKFAPLSWAVATKSRVLWNGVGPGPKLWPFLVKVRVGTGLPPCAVQRSSTVWPARRTAKSFERSSGSLSTLTCKDGSPGGPFCKIQKLAHLGPIYFTYFVP